MAAEGDLRRGGDLAELTQRVMGDDRVRLAKEGVERLLRPAAHEGGELVDVFGLGGVKLGRQAERQDSLNDHLLDAAETLGDGLPVADDDLEERVGLRPAEWSDSVLTFCGYLLASHRPIAPPSDTPLTCAFSTPIACMKPATSSAKNSVE